jgi:hypothetical protein
MRIKEEMTKEQFKELVGREDTQDDLERVNCPNAGEFGHSSCGWNYKHNCPMFERSDEK